MRALAVFRRVLRGFKRDKRTMILMMIAPVLVLSLMWVIFHSDTYKPKLAAIYARSFNAMFLMNAESERTVHFVSGRVKVGETIKGWVNVKEKIHGSDKHALIRGNFVAKVCKGQD